MLMLPPWMPMKQLVVLLSMCVEMHLLYETYYEM